MGSVGGGKFRKIRYDVMGTNIYTLSEFKTKIYFRRFQETHIYGLNLSMVATT